MRLYTHIVGSILLFVTFAIFDQFEYNNNWYFRCGMDICISRYNRQNRR